MQPTNEDKEPAGAPSALNVGLGGNFKTERGSMNAKDEEACRNLAASSVVGMPIRAALAELDELREAVKPFARIVAETIGRIPTERLSLADWHRLAKAARRT